MRRAAAALTALCLVLVSVWVRRVDAQVARPNGMGPRSPFLGSIPGEMSPGPPAQLTLASALELGLQHNLGMLLEEQRLRQGEGTRWQLLSGLLPDVSAVLRESRQKVNLAASGFGGFPGVPSLIGPFDVFDARVSVRQALVDLGAVHDARQGAAQLRAERYGYDEARAVVVQVVANLYFLAAAAESRVAAATAQTVTAEALYQLAVDQHRAGIVARLDVLRADVERKTTAQRRITAENEVTRSHSALGRAVGLPSGQALHLIPMVFAPLLPMEPEAARLEALRQRPDIRRAEARVAAAESALRAARAERLPTLSLDGNWGWIGNSVAMARGTFAAAATVHVPIFAAGRVEARLIDAAAVLKQRQLELMDLTAGVSYELETALNDVRAAAEQVTVSESATGLAAEALAQAGERFRAGVASNIEVTQAQAAEANAREAHIAALYSHSLAKASLGRIVGVDSRQFLAFLEGRAWQTVQ